MRIYPVVLMTMMPISTFGELLPLSPFAMQRRITIELYMQALFL
jgi:hypothetical protein